MNTASISIKSENSKSIHDSLLPEINSMDSERSSIKIKALNDELIIKVNAKDLNALKIVINHLIRLIKAFEDALKIDGVKKWQ
jgi:tRNA threonylcarbamoyladenosine modification (KEOPS) complex  Pcc1 subunit